MYAVIKSGGKQYRVASGDEVKFERSLLASITTQTPKIFFH